MDSSKNDDTVEKNLNAMDELDFEGWNKGDWHGVFSHRHTDDVIVDFKGQKPTTGLDEHIKAMEAITKMMGGTPPKIVSHPIRFGSGEWTCVVGESADGTRMVTVAKWKNGKISEEYIWS